MSSLYARVKALVEAELRDRPICHSRTREEKERKEETGAVFPSSTSLGIPQVTDGTLPADSDSLSTRISQVTDGTLCPHVDDPVLAEWYASHPEVVCARCWLARGR